MKVMDLHNNEKLAKLDVLMKFDSSIKKDLIFDAAGIRVFMRHHGIHPKTSDRLVKTMMVLKYLQNKWPLEVK
jgi:hypothetical protein